MINNKIQIEKITQTFNVQRKYHATNHAYTFDIFNDVWQLGTKDFVYLDWMYSIGYDDQTFVDLRVLLAELACSAASATIKIRTSAFKTLGNNLSLPELKLIWPTLTDSTKNFIATTLEFGVKLGMVQFEEINKFAQKNRAKIQKHKGILDPYNGVYSEYEYQTIKEQIRLATDRHTIGTNKENYRVSDLSLFSTLIFAQLMNATSRRPTQLVQMKWADVLPVGQRFSDHRQTKNESTPLTNYMFSDVETLHIRTFKGKNGGFRVSAESNSHRLDVNLSTLLLLYRKQYQLILVHSLSAWCITLNNDELNQIMMRCPIFPEVKLFSIQLSSKDELFKAMGMMSDAFHRTSSNARNCMENFCKRLDLKSDRIDDDKLTLRNNRFRHHILTNGARNGLSAPYLAKITGVSERAVEPYIDLSFEARSSIDQAFANKDILIKFGRTPVEDLLKQHGFAVLNEFDEEIGIQKNQANCVSCESKLGTPLGCYPCDNFTANENANHQQYLDKALSKYELNKANSNSATNNKLRKVILYIQATIDVCDERKLAQKGLEYD